MLVLQKGVWNVSEEKVPRAEILRARLNRKNRHRVEESFREESKLERKTYDNYAHLSYPYNRDGRHKVRSRKYIPQIRTTIHYRYSESMALVLL